MSGAALSWRPLSFGVLRSGVQSGQPAYREIRPSGDEPSDRERNPARSVRGKVGPPPLLCGPTDRQAGDRSDSLSGSPLRQLAFFGD
jgi:hypothetical protein